jgi:nicotinamidase/pyrazinamidase
MTPINFASAALLVVDAQQGFSELCPSELPVPGALAIVPYINRLLRLAWRRIDASQDWHPPDHCSFKGRKHDLYPPHCVMNTPGAEFLPGLDTHRFHAVWRKGYDAEYEAYALTAQHEGYPHLLRGHGIKTVVICGIATNICCYFAARDLRKEGFEVLIVEDASAGLDVPAAGLFQEKTKAEGQALGIRYVQTVDIVNATNSQRTSSQRQQGP